VTEGTNNVLLEGASWNFINIRRTLASQRMSSEAGYRFSRGVHPEIAPHGVRYCLQRMAEWCGGQIAADLLDEYPQPVEDPIVDITPAEVRRILGIDLSAEQIIDLLSRLGFECKTSGEVVKVKTPPHRLDIGSGIIGEADIIEEIARLYGYQNFEGTRMADELPPQRNNLTVEWEERVRDVLVTLGLQEVISYRLTTPEREARPYLTSSGKVPYIQLQNPISPERSYMRRSLLASVLEALERNARLSERLALFEIGAVFLPQEGEDLPREPRRLAVAISGKRHAASWQESGTDAGTEMEGATLNFFDLKGTLETLFEALQLDDVTFQLAEHPSFHPGKCAKVMQGEMVIGVLGELHPLVKERYDYGTAAVLAADLDLEAMLARIPLQHEVAAVPQFPPVLEDIAVVVDEGVPADRIIGMISEAGGRLLADVSLFDVFRGSQIGADKKSLAFRLTYQDPERTLTDEEAARVRQRIVRRLEEELGAKLRS
jgi:phenylalanyl-tRNA synthetase beta chain